jgi:hypothetical protein
LQPNSPPPLIPPSRQLEAGEVVTEPLEEFDDDFQAASDPAFDVPNWEA